MLHAINKTEAAEDGSVHHPDYHKVVTILVSLTWCEHDGYDAFFYDNAFAVATQKFKTNNYSRFAKYGA